MCLRTSTAFLLSLLVFCNLSSAGVIPDTQRDKLVVRVLINFWGHAKLANGQVVHPLSEIDRKTIPISRMAANRVIDAGEISALGQRCRLDWRAHYYSIMSAARKKGMSETQVAFISFLHGAAQGKVSSAMSMSMSRSASKSCSEEQRTRVEGMLKQSKELGLEGF